MKYKGRFLFTFVLFIIIVVTKLSFYFLFKLSPLAFPPIFAIIALIVFWWLGWNYDRLELLSEKDVLTNLYNRRYVIKIFPKLLNLVNRKKENLSLLFIDVDNFKRINDTHGHDKGDHVLRCISRIITENSNQNDLVARWSGDELLILVPSITAKETEKKVRQIHNAISKLTKVLEIDVSVSIGVSIYPTNGENLEDLLKVADQKMYIAKSTVY